MAMSRAADAEECEIPKNLILLQEMRQVVMHERGIHSAIFIDVDTENEIIRRDLDRMDQIIAAGDTRVYLDETSVFTIAHALRRGISVDHYCREYCERLRALRAEILFFEVPPAIAWARRKPRYEERVAGFPTDQAAAVLALYRSYLFGLHDALLETRSRLQLPVRCIDASIAIEDTLEASARTFLACAAERGIALSARF
jgi:hypothetical protein